MEALNALAAELPDAVRAVVANAWDLRQRIEVESELRFAALSRGLQSAGFPAPLVERAQVASSDEHRHALECEQYVRAYGPGSPLAPVPTAPREYAPAWLSPLQRLTYEMVVTCCIAETHSATNLVTLFNAHPPEPLYTTLHNLSRDEVTHGQLGWAYLEAARERLDIGFLAPFLPDMMGSEGAERASAEGDSASEDSRLTRHGVLPQSSRRELFLASLEQVIFPGFERLGVETRDARAWLWSHRTERRGATYAR